MFRREIVDSLNSALHTFATTYWRSKCFVGDHSFCSASVTTDLSHRSETEESCKNCRDSSYCSQIGLLWPIWMRIDIRKLSRKVILNKFVEIWHNTRHPSYQRRSFRMCHITTLSYLFSGAQILDFSGTSLGFTS